MNLYVGTSGYSYKEWKGSFYPGDLPAKGMLRYYGERFRTVEINNTFYRLPTASVLEAWAAEVPADFKFVIKASQKITHFARLKNVEESVAYLLKVCGTLKDRLGPLLFQLPPNLKKDVRRLRDFLTLRGPLRGGAAGVVGGRRGERSSSSATSRGSMTRRSDCSASTRQCCVSPRRRMTFRSPSSRRPTGAISACAWRTTGTPN